MRSLIDRKPFGKHKLISNSLLATFLFLGICIASIGVAWSADVISTVAGGGPYQAPALAVDLGYPYALAVDTSGNIFLVARAQLLRVDASGTLTVVAGDGASETWTGLGIRPVDAEPDALSGLALDAHGNLYFPCQLDAVCEVETETGIITRASGGELGYGGDGGPAKQARMRFPQAVFVDAAGNLYISDTGNNRVRKVEAGTGIITTVAGNGTRGYGGDGGPAVSASIAEPWGLVLNAEGDLFIADFSNSRIRRVEAESGIITTVAGTGIRGFAGDGGAATAALLSSPSGVALDANGNLYIADSGNSRIRRVDKESGIIRTVAGNGGFGFNGDGGPATAASLGGAYGLALDAMGNLFIADTGNYRVRKVEEANQIIATIAGSGAAGLGSGDGWLATATRLAPEDVALDANGNLYIAERGHARVRKVEADSGIITTVAGPPSTGVNANSVVSDAAGNLYLSDSLMSRVYKLEAGAGTLTTVAGNGSEGFSGDGGPATAATLFAPHGLALDAVDNLYIADLANSRIREVEAASGIITTVAGNGTVAFSGDGGPATEASLAGPRDVVLDRAGNIYILDYGNDRVRKVEAGSGIITTVAGNGTKGFSGDGGPAVAASLYLPQELALDAVGNIYITDAGNSRIRKVEARSGIITTVAGNGSVGLSGDGGPPTEASLNFPEGLVLDDDCHMYFADQDNWRVRLVTMPTCTQQCGDVIISFSSPFGSGSGTVFWSTTTEVDLLGFNVVNLASDGKTTQLNPELIPCEECNTGVGHAYSYVVPKHKSGRDLFIEMLRTPGNIEVCGPATRQGKIVK